MTRDCNVLPRRLSLSESFAAAAERFYRLHSAFPTGSRASPVRTVEFLQVLSRRLVRSMASCPGRRAREDASRADATPAVVPGTAATRPTPCGVIGADIIALCHGAESMWDKMQLGWDWSTAQVKCPFLSLCYVTKLSHPRLAVVVLDLITAEPQNEIFTSPRKCRIGLCYSKTRLLEHLNTGCSFKAFITLLLIV